MTTGLLHPALSQQATLTSGRALESQQPSSGLQAFPCLVSPSPLVLGDRCLFPASSGDWEEFSILLL